MWLMAFTDAMENLLAKYTYQFTTLWIKSKKPYVLTMENITLVIDSVSNFIPEVKENDV